MYQCPLQLLLPIVTVPATHAFLEDWVAYSRTLVQVPSAMQLFSGPLPGVGTLQS